MSQGTEFDVKQAVLFDGSFGPDEINQVLEAISLDMSQFLVLRDAVRELRTKEDLSPAGMVRLGVCLYILGRFEEAIEVLRQGDGCRVCLCPVAQESCEGILVGPVGFSRRPRNMSFVEEHLPAFLACPGHQAVWWAYVAPQS